MLPILVALISGITLGIIFRQRKSLFIAADRATTWSVYVLVFFLGLSVGVNRQIMNALPNLGKQALILSVGSIAGSVLVSALVYYYFFRGSYEK